MNSKTEIEEYQNSEIFKYKKRKPQNSKVSKRSDHKHQYEDVIVNLGFAFALKQRCKICGRLNKDKYLTKKYTKILSTGKTFVANSPLDIEEIKKIYPNIPIIEED